MYNKQTQMDIKYRLNIVLIILLFFSQQTAVSEEMTFVFSEFRPYEYTEKGNAKGINIDLIKKVCTEMGIIPVFKELPWKRALDYAKSGKADAVFSLFRTGEREKIYMFPEQSLNTVKMALYKGRKNNLQITKLDDLNGLNVGVYRGSSYGPLFDRAEGFNKDAANTNRQLLYKQVKEKTDCFIMDEAVADYWISTLGYSDLIKPLDFIVYSQETFIAFNKSADIDINKFSNLIAEEKKSIIK